MQHFEYGKGDYVCGTISALEGGRELAISFNGWRRRVLLSCAREIVDRDGNLPDVGKTPFCEYVPGIRMYLLAMFFTFYQMAIEKGMTVKLDEASGTVWFLNDDHHGA